MNSQEHTTSFSLIYHVCKRYSILSACQGHYGHTFIVFIAIALVILICNTCICVSLPLVLHSFTDIQYLFEYEIVCNVLTHFGV